PRRASRCARAGSTGRTGHLGRPRRVGVGPLAFVRHDPPLEARMTSFVSTIDTQFGPFTLIVDADGSVLAAGWSADENEVAARIHPDLRSPTVRRNDLGAASRAAIAYHRGELNAPDEVPIRQHSPGTFLPAAWKTLRDVRAGETVTYTELAARTGNPAAVRAAAQACARTAPARFVPCHRVMRIDGTLGGFRWGLDVKRLLLTHEMSG